MDTLNFSMEQVKEINHWYIYNIDKWNRMHNVLSIDLFEYKDGIIYLEITNHQKIVLSTRNTAIWYARRYKEFVSQLKYARGFVVVFKTRDNRSGFTINLDTTKEELTKLNDEFNLPDNSQVHSVFSGIFTKDMEHIQRDDRLIDK